MCYYKRSHRYCINWSLILSIEIFNLLVVSCLIRNLLVNHHVVL